MLVAAWARTLGIARNQGRTEQLIEAHEMRITEHEERLRDVERQYFTREDADAMKRDLLEALYKANAEAKKDRAKEIERLMAAVDAMHARLDRLHVPPSRGNGGR